MNMLLVFISYLLILNCRNNYLLDIGLLDCWILEYVMCIMYVYYLNFIF